MKHLKLAMICLGFAVAAMVVSEADAGKIKKPPKGSRTEDSEELTEPHRFDSYPGMDFVGGTLSRDAHAGWKIGNTPLFLKDGCVITMDGVEEQGWLEEGREAVIMGARIGNAISAWSVQISQPTYKTMGMSQSNELKEPGPNPNVGKVLKRVE
jgi:hypothetical protein